VKRSLSAHPGLAILAVFFLLFAAVAGGRAAGSEARISKASCVSCHPDLSGLLPKDHPQAKAGGIGACLGCHKPEMSGKPRKSAFSSALHRAHSGNDARMDCMICHTWTPGRRFGLVGSKVSFGTPSKDQLQEMKSIVTSWVRSGYTDSLHGKANVFCGGCHGSEIPKEGDTVANRRCLACHGPAEKLATRSAPGDFPDRNPHKSHLGEIDCTVCHKGHAESKVYCLDCHKLFKFGKIPGGGAGR